MKAFILKSHDLTRHLIHLGLGTTAEVEPKFTGSMDWYVEYGSRHDSDGAEGRLVSMHTFSESWDVWEMHPKGSEVVLCTAGTMVLHQEQMDGSKSTITLRAGEYAINKPGVWHTADVDGEATALFITAGLGTEHRPR
jgi:quercetin dioxygenase-like cupin family protein